MSDLNITLTPMIAKSSKRLGMRRSIKLTTVTSATKSDIHVNYKSLQTNENSLTPLTRGKYLNQRRSTDCRPYRLSLNRNIRRYYRKKKLDFFINTQGEDIAEPLMATTSNYLDRTDENDLKPEDVNEQIYSKTDVKIKTEVDEDKILLEELELQRHQLKVEELRESIELWKRGFQEAIQDLSTKTQEPVDENLLDKLAIPQNMMKYL